jgi:hypothetical protein
MCWTPLLTNTNKINKTGALLQPTGGDDEPNIVLLRNRSGQHNTGLERKEIIGQHKILKR